LLQSAAVDVTATIVAPDGFRASNIETTWVQFTKQQLTTLTASTMTSEIGFTVTEVDSPVSGSSFVEQTAPEVEQTQAASSSSDLNGGAVAGIVIACCIAIVFVLLSCYMASRERSGKPIFQPLGESAGTTVSAKPAMVSVSSTSATSAAATPSDEKV